MNSRPSEDLTLPHRSDCLKEGTCLTSDIRLENYLTIANLDKLGSVPEVDIVEPRWRLRLLSTVSAFPRGHIPSTIRVPSRTRSFAVTSPRHTACSWWFTLVTPERHERVRAAPWSQQTRCPGVLRLDRVISPRRYRHHPMAMTGRLWLAMATAELSGAV